MELPFITTRATSESLRRYTVNSDRFDRRVFASVLERDHALRELHHRGVQRSPVFSELLCDVFCSFHKFRPQLEPRRSLASDVSINRVIMWHILGSDAFLNLRTHTFFDDVRSAWATRRLMEEVWDELEEVADRQHKSGHGGEAPQLARRPERSPDRASQRTAETDPTKVHRSRHEARKGPNHAGQAALLLDGKNVRVELEKQIDRALVLIAAEADADAAVEVLIRGWGVEPGQLVQLDPQLRLQLAQRFGRRLCKFAAMVGRYRRLAFSVRESKTVGIPEEMVDVVLGNDLDRVLRSELLTLTHSALRFDFYRRYIDKELLQYEMAGMQRMGRGPIVACVDCSGSMRGEREVVAKALCLGLLSVARAERRAFLGVLFGASGEKASFLFPRDTAVDTSRIIEFAGSFFGGGTDFETPLREAMNQFDADQFCKGDLVFITDGLCQVRDSFQREYDEMKQQKQFKTFSVLVTGNVTDSAPEVLKRISDRVALSSQLDENVAGEIFATV